MTERQQQVYNFIVEYWKQHSHSPLLREVAEGLGFQLPTGVARVAQVLGRLEKLGVITRKRGHRNIFIKL